MCFGNRNPSRSHIQSELLTPWFTTVHLCLRSSLQIWLILLCKPSCKLSSRFDVPQVTSMRSAHPGAQETSVFNILFAYYRPFVSSKARSGASIIKSFPTEENSNSGRRCWTFKALFHHSEPRILFVDKWISVASFKTVSEQSEGASSPVHYDLLFRISQKKSADFFQHSLPSKGRQVSCVDTRISGILTKGFQAHRSLVS